MVDFSFPTCRCVAILLRPVKPRFMENAMKLEFAVLKEEETLDKTRKTNDGNRTQLTCAKSIPMKFTSCKEHLPSYKTNTAMLFVTENKDSCDSTAVLRFSGHKWQETQMMWQLGGGERSPPLPPPPYNRGCHP